jgi:hypothetical protein
MGLWLEEKREMHDVADRLDTLKDAYAEGFNFCGLNTINFNGCHPNVFSLSSNRTQRSV